MVVDIKALSLSATASSLGPIESKRWVNELHTAISVNGNRIVIVLRNWAQCSRNPVSYFRIELMLFWLYYVNLYFQHCH